MAGPAEPFRASRPLCPFCGNIPHLDEESAIIAGQRTGHRFAIACGSCEACSPGSDTLEGAWAAWSRRSPSDKNVAMRFESQNLGEKPARPETAIRERIKDALSSSLTQSYDCTRVWEAWSYKTMSQDDFHEISDNDERIDEIADAVLDAFFFRSQDPATACVSPEVLAEITKLRAQLSLAQNDALRYYMRCDQAARSFQAGNTKEAERQIMGKPGESDLVARIAAAMTSLPE